MPYYVIEKQPVFLTQKKYRLLIDEALKDKDAHFKIKSTIDFSYSKNKEKEEAEKLMYDTLKCKHDTDRENFIDYWVNFELVGEEAQVNVWDLLYDYCHYYGHSYLSDTRDEVSRLFNDLNGESYMYPMGKVFLLNHIIKPHKWYWKYTSKMTDRYVKVLINIDKVSIIIGNLTQYKIILDNGVILSCGKDFFSIVL